MPEYNPNDPSTFTVAAFEMGELPDAIKAEDLLGYNCLILGVGIELESDTFWEFEPGQDARYPDGKRATGQLAHVVAYRPGSAEDESGLPKDVKFTDSLFPAVFWQTITKRVAERSFRQGRPFPFSLTKTPPNAGGKQMFVTLPIRDAEVHDILALLFNKYIVETSGLPDDAPLSALVEMIHETREIEAPGNVVDAEILSD